MAKVGGGVNPMHLSDTAHPFSKGPFKGSSKFAKTVGVGPNPGGEGNMVSANAAMKTKRPLNGPGKS
jgi:hypothetical protein